MMKNILIFTKQFFLFILTVLMIQITAAVNMFPQILTETYNQTLNLSSTAILTCHIRDLGDHHVTWFKLDPLTSLSFPLAAGKQLFTTDNRYSISFYSTSPRDSFWSLEIYQLNPSDEGTYICKIANRRASVSAYIHLHIQIPMMIYPTHVYVEPGATVKLNCTILMHDDNPEASSITWHFLSNQTKPRDVFVRKNLVNNTLSSYLIINHAEISHTGIWTCDYKHQRVNASIIVEKDILRHQRISALLSNNSNQQKSSIHFVLFILFIVAYKH